MIPRKLAETFFRRWWVMAIPVIALPLLSLGFVESPVEYESSARIWVSELLDDGPPAFNEDTPSERQVKVLQDLFATESFRTEVALAAGLLPASAPPEAVDPAADAIGKAISVGTLGPNLFGITARTEDPKLAQDIVNAAIVQYQARLQADGERQATIVLQYFQEQLTLAQAELERLQAELVAWQKAHPVIPGTPTVPDAELLRIESRVDAQARVVDRLNASLQDAKLANVSGADGLSSFTLQDPPKLPAAPLPVSMMSKAAYPAAGLFVGLMIAAAYLYLTYRADHTIRSSEDLRGLSVPLLGYVPQLRPAGSLLARFTPLRLVQRRRNFARGVATSLAPQAEQAGGSR